MTMTPPDSLWYNLNAVYFWPFRGWEMITHPQAILERGEYRYFRFIVPNKYAEEDRIHSALNAACILMNGGACYEENGEYYCEGFLEPQCDGVTVGRIKEYLKATDLEIASEGVGVLQEMFTDLDDFLAMKSYYVVPTELASADEQLLPGNYYSVAASYYGATPNALMSPPTAAQAKTWLDKHGMGFYQPYPDMDPIVLSFILFTGANAPSPRDLNTILQSDYLAVNRLPLDKGEQESLWSYDAGKNVPDAVLRFFESTGTGISDTIDTGGFLTRNTKWLLLVGAGLGVLYAGIQIRKYKGSKDA